MIEFDEKGFDKQLVKKILIPNAIKLIVWFYILKYLSYLEILKPSVVIDIKMSTMGIMGVYIGILVYRAYMEKALPLIGLSIDDLDEATAHLFPEKKKFRRWNKKSDIE